MCLPHPRSPAIERVALLEQTNGFEALRHDGMSHLQLQEPQWRGPYAFELVGELFHVKLVAERSARGSELRQRGPRRLQVAAADEPRTIGSEFLAASPCQQKKAHRQL